MRIYHNTYQKINISKLKNYLYLFIFKFFEYKYCNLYKKKYYQALITYYLIKKYFASLKYILERHKNSN